jgi:hypothetical protein
MSPKYGESLSKLQKIIGERASNALVDAFIKPSVKP